MGLMGLIGGAPLVPVRGVLGLAHVVSDEAERQLSDPVAVRRRIEEIAESRDAGLLSDEEAARLAYEAVQWLFRQPGKGLEET